MGQRWLRLDNTVRGLINAPWPMAFGLRLWWLWLKRGSAPPHVLVGCSPSKPASDENSSLIFPETIKYITVYLASLVKPTHPYKDLVD
ncbi:hypothetical protein EJ02DRAFT_460546 [Clathrospora elynae]|uniref:Uncharacterized protein n=1 Tax=Clathrospora elynae TaxID=706981 RepID=A0A6A5S783_9PLEO|nr:hypothetical protein EJ02DRAFT_460546 [Clathrospora elynae]